MNHVQFFTIICICFYLSVFYQFCSAADTIALNQSISGNQTIVSPGQRFELGFFSPGTSNNSYLGIWYKTTPDIVVWVANRNNPLTDSHGVFTITSNGTPLLLNSTNGVIWSPNVSRVATTPVVHLLDAGNLVLVDKESEGSSNYLWQSFDYPGDTLLPGMVLGENIDTGREQYLTSWRGTDDPSAGDFIYTIENHGLPQKEIRNGTRKSYRSGPWNGVQFNGNPLGSSSRKVFKNKRLVAISAPYNTSVLTRLVLNQSGVVQRYRLDMKKNEWHLMYTIPNNECSNYGKCGPNGVCNSNRSPICQCVKGYTPKHQQEWEFYDWSSGCARIEPPNCQNGDGFLNLSRVKLPDLLQSQLKKNTSLRQCETECLRNCSCIAYTNPYVSAVDTSCLMWYGDLVDIREFDDEVSVQNVYVRLPISELESTSGSNKNKKKNKRPLKIILISTASGVFLLGPVCGCIFLKIRRTRKKVRRKEEDLELPLFDLATIAAATEGFSEENMIGEGGFGPVYKGNLSNGQEIAVKRLSRNSGQGAEEFKNEVILIAKLQHRNLIRLLGCCIQGEERLLIYEYMLNKSLDHFIFDPRRSKLLTWPKRFDIIMGIARGILYLHQDSRLKIIHRDLKTTNILLDSTLEPKVSDFGLARIFQGDQTFGKTKRVIGTYGYMAPEYAIDGKFSVKSDVFSVGVMILEIVSGKKNRNFSHLDHHYNLLGHAWLLWTENRGLELMDTCLKDSFVESQVKRCIQVGLLCVQGFAEDRPAMSSVLFMLGNEGAVLPQPKQPGFFVQKSSGNARMRALRHETINTAEMVTVTQLEPR